MLHKKATAKKVPEKREFARSNFLYIYPRNAEQRWKFGDQVHGRSGDVRLFYRARCAEVLLFVKIFL
jgi:hypothetical protein